MDRYAERFDMQRKEIKKKWSFCRVQLLCLCVMCIFTGCRNTTVYTPAATPAEMPEPEPSPTPSLINPVQLYWQRYNAAFGLAMEAMELALETDITSLNRVSDVRLHVQHMQYLFMPFISLGASEEELWEGVVSGAVNGVSYVRGTAESAVLSCALYQDGRIYGTLADGILNCTWEKYRYYDEPLMDEDGNEISSGEYEKYCSAFIQEQNGSYTVYVDWMGVTGILYTGHDGTVCFNRNFQGIMEEITSGLAPGEWAEWRFADGIFSELIPGGEPEIPENADDLYRELEGRVE